MENREFYLDCDGIKLHTKMDFPKEEKEKYPMVIVVHGLTGNMEETHIKGVSMACNSIGYVTLRVELYGHGKSEGNFKDHTVMHWMLEIMRVIDYARSLEFISDLYLTGHSQGGAAIVLAAALKEDELKALMPLAPAMMLQEASCTGGFPMTEYAPDNLEKEILLFGEHPISSNYMKVARLLPFKDAVKNFRKPVLIVHSETDELVPFAYSEKLQKDYRNAQLVSIPEDNHCFEKHLDMVQKTVIKFLKEQQ